MLVKDLVLLFDDVRIDFIRAERKLINGEYNRGDEKWIFNKKPSELIEMGYENWNVDKIFIDSEAIVISKGKLLRGHYLKFKNKRRKKK